jgi:NAD(P)-dependent dehydrogenase (short-subunit alcohol dehydrogenase family)
VINLGSICSYMAYVNGTPYSGSKGAIKLYTQGLAADLAADGIRVNGLAPGVIATPMTEETRSKPERLAGFLARTPLGRVGEPEELVGPVLFLASDLSSYVTGHMLAVDGGFLAD